MKWIPGTTLSTGMFWCCLTGLENKGYLEFVEEEVGVAVGVHLSKE